MYRQGRIEKILEVLRANGYVTVKYLVSVTGYSNATINRDLNIMEKQKLVKRSYGGVEIVANKGVPLPFRYHKMKSEKLKIAKKAAEYIEDGDTVFIDASTTTEYIAGFLTEKKDLTVITNNMAIISRLSEYGINCICLGGKVVEPPFMLSGDDAVECAMKYRADKMFFSTGMITENGYIATNTQMYYLLQTVMLKNSNKKYYLADHDKIKKESVIEKYLCDLNGIDIIISDKDFNDELKNKFSNTEFIKV